MISVHPGRLTQYFTDARPITPKAGKQIAVKLGLDKDQQDYFVHLCETDKRRKKIPEPRLLNDDELAMMVEWYHFAVLSLFSTKDFKMDPVWIGERLGIPTEIAQSSLDRLIRIGMVKVDDSGKAELVQGPLTTTSTIPSQFLRLSHQETLRHVVDNIQQVPMEKRDLSSITVAINTDKIDEAKVLIRNFRRKLADLLSQGKKNEVYTLNVQLFPLSKEVSQ